MNEQETRKIDRKSFLKIIGGVLALIPLFLVFPLISKRKKFLSKKRFVEIPLDIQEGITFFPDCIVNRRGMGVEVFSSRCSHLGCRINRQMGSELVCPCHGSRYSTEGRVLSGPAARDLEVLEYRIDEKKKKFIITIPV